MKTKIYFFYGLLLISFLLLAGRLAELQLILGSHNRALAEGNRIKKINLPAPRGMIYDRNGKELVHNVPIYRIQNPSSGADHTAGKFTTISREEALKLEAKGETENLKTDIGRVYPYGAALAHVLGYLGELNQNEVDAGKGSLGDFTGRTGIEEQYDGRLRGVDGGELFEVNAEGVKIREIGKNQPIVGENLTLAIDGRLSQVAFEALQGPAGRAGLPAGRQGAVVATDAKTGAVLVLVSSPSFDPGKISAEMLTDENRPMFNRAVSGVYPPGSTFKIVTAASGLEEGKIDKNTLYDDTGAIQVGDYRYNNWYFTQYGRTEGQINLVRAIARSTDTFFYKVGEWVGPDKLAQWAKAFGLGKITGIDIGAEAAGLVPDPEWKLKTTGERWFLGNTYHFAIGQADLLTTPLQVNIMTSVIANNGRLCQPSVLQTESDCRDLKLKPETISLIKEGMKEVCSPGGTAFPFFDFEPRVACKSGTAEFGNPQGKTHAWLTAFAPVNPAAAGPQIVVTALVEGGGEGSYVAAPIVKKVIEEWFKR
jgi:penicillin-binding protein 2